MAILTLKKNRRLDLQAQIILTLIAVIIPTFLLVTLVEYQLFRPVLEEEVRQIGIASAKNLAAEILSQKMFFAKDPSQTIEGRIQELVYSQPNIIRMDVVTRDAQGGFTWIASNIEQEPGASPPVLHFRDSVVTDYKTDAQGIHAWEIYVPIESRTESKVTKDGKPQRKIHGNVYVMVSMRFVNRMVQAIWRTTAVGAFFTVLVLIIVLSFFLRRTIANDRLLRKVEDVNVQLTERLHEAQRQLMNMEKLAVMGQLTASFAHEIGTPLNAIGGHLQLLKEEISQDPHWASSQERVDVIQGQLSKIESVVKSFLQSTAKPSSQKQLVDLNRLADQTIGLVKPRADTLDVEIKRDYDLNMGPLRAVPLDLEQIILNLLNNSLDSLRVKRGLKSRSEKLVITMSTRVVRDEKGVFSILSVHDTGMGIKKADLASVLKPFFTTKRPGEGTGLGLAICQELAKKYGGVIEVEAKESAWARVTLRIPEQTERQNG